MALLRSDEPVTLHKDKGVVCQFCGERFGRFGINGGIAPIRAHEYRCPKKKEHIANFRMRSCGCNVCLILLAAEKELRK